MSASPSFFGHQFTTAQIVAALDAFHMELPMKFRNETAELVYRLFAAHVAIIDSQQEAANN